MVRSCHWLLSSVAAFLLIALTSAPSLVQAGAAPVYPNVKTDVRTISTQPAANADGVRIRAELRHTMLTGGRTRYGSVAANVPMSAVRQQATKALSRGRVHPALFAASVAAGLMLDQDSGEIVEEVSQDIDIDYSANDVPEEGTQGGWSSNWTSSWPEDASDFYPSCLGAVESDCAWEVDSISADSGGGDSTHVLRVEGNSTCTNGVSSKCYFVPSPSSEPDLGYPYPGEDVSDTTEEPVPSEELDEKLDPYIEPELADEVARDPDSDWARDTDDDPRIGSSPYGLPEQLRDAIGRNADNTEADARGEQRPHDDKGASRKSASDSTLEEITTGPRQTTGEGDSGREVDGTTFPSEPEPDWTVNMYGPDDLEEEDINPGAPATCPQPYSFQLDGFVSGTYEIPYDHLCDFAERVNPFFMVGAWVIAGFIVIRR